MTKQEFTELVDALIDALNEMKKQPEDKSVTLPERWIGGAASCPYIARLNYNIFDNDPSYEGKAFLLDSDYDWEIKTKGSSKILIPTKP